MLESGRTLEPEQAARLLARLREVRRAAVDVGQEASGEDENAALRARLSRSVVLLEADRAFREELGIGLGEFMQGLEPDRIEEADGMDPLPDGSAPPEPPAADDLAGG